jgi:hypothetical protein
MPDAITVALRVEGGTTQDPSAALLELTEPLARRLLARVDQVTALCAEDPEIRHVTLRGAQLTWLNSSWEDASPDATELSDEELLDDEWSEVSAERLAEIRAVLAADPEVETRVEGEALIVGPEGVSWRSYPKHGGETFVTATLSREDLVELSRLWKLADTPPAPDPEDRDYLERAFGYGTLDHLAGVLHDRTDDGTSHADIKRAMAAFGPEALWDTVVGPMLDRLETVLELGARAEGAER